MAKNDLHPASSIFLPLPSSSSFYLVTKVTAIGIAFELLSLIRVQTDNGVGMKLAVGERKVLDLGLIRNRQRQNQKRTRDHGVGDGMLGAVKEVEIEGMEELEEQSPFILGIKDIRNMFIYAKYVTSRHSHRSRTGSPSNG